jgi:1,4-alpha-glucan branching enzyme
MSEPLGSVCLVLHGHIPYVLGHGTWPHGSNMIYEAAADTYIPLLWALEELAHEGIPANLTLGLTPITMEQLADERFKEWFANYLQHKAWLAQRNAEEFSRWKEGHLTWLAGRWLERYRALYEAFTGRYQRDLLGQFRAHQEAGHLEIISSAATHGYLPLLYEDGSLQAQVRQGVATYERFMGCRPRGFWLPECAYRPRCFWAPNELIETQPPWPRKGVEEFLGENGFDYFFVDSHMLPRAGDPLPVTIDHQATLGKLWGNLHRAGDYAEPRTLHRPYFVGRYFEDHPPVACLFRDPGTSEKVWSGDIGYPGDPNYLDFHKKHLPGDLRYWRVSGSAVEMAAKAVYEPTWAEDRVREHAGNFLWTVKETLRHAPHHGWKKPVVVSPFDAELFGHWWHEGVSWLVHVLRWMHQDPELKVETARHYLRENEPHAALSLPEGSWGAGGGHQVWLSPETAWSWQRIYDAERDLQALLRDHGTGHDEPMQRLLCQAGRELLLLQASDWQFLITTKGAADAATQRLHAHHSDYKRCAELARRYGRGEILSDDDWRWLGELESRDRPFANLEPGWFGIVKQAADRA